MESQIAEPRPASRPIHGGGRILRRASLPSPLPAAMTRDGQEALRPGGLRASWRAGGSPHEQVRGGPTPGPALRFEGGVPERAGGEGARWRAAADRLSVLG